MRLFLREANDCKAGTQWYVCNVPQFRGCCSVDACHQGGCPDRPSTTTITGTFLDPTNTPSATQSASTTSSFTPTLSPSATISSTVSPSTGTRQTSSRTTSRTTSQTTSYSSAVSSTSSPTLAVQFPADSPSPASESSMRKGAIIAGSVAGMLALALIVALLWCCCMKRKNGRAATSRLAEPKRPSYREMNAEEVQRLSPHDVFAPFGGYQRSKSRRERSASDASVGSQQTVIINRAARPVSEVDEQDVRIPDMEKSSLCAPPLDDHPAMHPLPGQSPEVPIYHSAQASTSPELAQHPAHLMSANLRLHPKTNLTFPFTDLASSTKISAEENKANNSLSTLPFQKRQSRFSKTLLQYTYTPISANHSSPIDQTQPPLQDNNPSLPSHSELPAIVPQELSSTPAHNPTNRLEMFKVAAERRMRCSPISLGVSPSKANPSIISPPPPFNLPPHTTTIETLQAPYHLSPRSADSPALGSEFYQSHIVSPEFPSDHTFNSKPHTRLPISKPFPPHPLHHRASPSPPPPQLPRIDTGMSTSTSTRFLKLNGKETHKESLGKGNECVMDWATYKDNFSASSGSLGSTPPKTKKEERSMDVDVKLSNKNKKQEEEEESPILPPFLLRPGRGRGRGSAMLTIGDGKGKEMVDRWSGSTATGTGETSATRERNGEVDMSVERKSVCSLLDEQASVLET